MNRFFINFFIFVFIFSVFTWFRFNLPAKDVVGTDFDAIYLESKKLMVGEHIYSRILTGSITDQFAGGYGKYPVLFPSVYYFMILFSNFGKISSKVLLENFQFLIYILDMLTSIVIFKLLSHKSNISVGYLGVCFWLFNRWNTNGYYGVVFDSVSFLFLLTSAYFFERKNYLSAVFLSLSLLLKHFGLFVLPIYTLIWLKENGFKKSLIYSCISFLPLVLFSIPSLLIDSKGFFYSIMFNFTRNPDEDFFLPKFGQIAYQAYQQDSLFVRFLMLMINRIYFFGSYFLMLFVSYINNIKILNALLLVFFWFFLFNSKAFAQYNIWMVGSIIANFYLLFPNKINS